MAQAIICVFGILAMWLVTSRSPRFRMYGCVAGLVAQPAWLYTTYSHEQWGIFAMSFLYTASWLRGLANNWRDQRNA